MAYRYQIIDVFCLVLTISTLMNIVDFLLFIAKKCQNKNLIILIKYHIFHLK